MTVDLCVVAYNTKPEIERLLTTLNSDLDQFDSRPWSLYIADNGDDDTGEMVLDRRSELYVDYYGAQGNIGYSAAVNYLANVSKASSGEVIGILNGDVWLTTSDVIEVLKVFDTNPQVSILGPKQRNERGQVVHGGIGGTNTAPKHRGWKTSDPEDILFKDFSEVVTVSGSAFFIRREVWDTLMKGPVYQSVFGDVITKWNPEYPAGEMFYGAFLPTPHYYEETFCSYFARASGYGVYYAGNISIGHSWHASAPVGGGRDGQFKTSQAMFRYACDRLGIQHD